MDKMNNFDQAKPLEDMDPGERDISNTGGVTQQKAEEITHPKPEYYQRGTHVNIASMSEEDFNKMNTFEKSVFSKYGLDLREDVNFEKMSSMTQINMLDRLKALEALILITMKYRDSSAESLRDFTKLYEDYKSEIKRYERLYNKVYEPSDIKNKEEAEEFLYEYMHPNNVDATKKFFKESSGKIENGYQEVSEKDKEAHLEYTNLQAQENLKNKTLKPEEVFEEELV